MLNEFIEKVVVHEGEGAREQPPPADRYLPQLHRARLKSPPISLPQWKPRNNAASRRNRRQRKPVHRSLPKRGRKSARQRNGSLPQGRKRGLLTPEEQAADEARLAHNRAWQKEWREKRKAAEPPKPPKLKSLKELAALQKAGADLTPEEAERLAAYRERKNRQHKAWYERQKAAQPPKPRTLKELAAALDAGQTLTPEETERLEASRSRKKNAYQELKAQAETDPAAAAELARRRAYHSEATKKSRQKMYEEAAAGNPEAQARYENFLAARRGELPQEEARRERRTNRMRRLIDNGNRPITPKPHIGHYGRLRKAYLEQYRHPPLYRPCSQREAVPTPYGNRPGGAGYAGLPHAPPCQRSGSHRSPQSCRPDEMGGIDEQLQGESRGNRNA